MSDMISDAELHNVNFSPYGENSEFQGSVKSETEKLMKSGETYLSQNNGSEKIPGIISAQFAENLARSRQTDMCISEFGELMVDLSVKYTS